MPICRIRDAAWLYHLRGQTSVHWSSIRTHRLSSYHGEFCKLFCSQTSRQVDFFCEDSAKSGEQLLNMIGMCTAFSIGNQCLVIDIQKESRSKAFRCTVHFSPPVILSVVASAHNPSVPDAPQPSKVQPIKLWIVSMNDAGVWICDGRKLQADVQVSFSDSGCGLPSTIYAGCCYQPACIEAGSFQLLRPNFCSLFNVKCSNINDMKLALDKVRKGAMGQPISKDLRDLLKVDSDNHAALKLAVECIKKGPVDCIISNYLIRLISVDPDDHEALKLALEKLKSVLFGENRSELKEPSVISLRHKLCHNLLTLDIFLFDALVACARSMLQGVCSVNAFMNGNAEGGGWGDTDETQQSLAEIERIVKHDSSFQVSTLNEHECDTVSRMREQLLEEREKGEQMTEERDRLKVKLARKFDSFAPYTKKDIQDQLVDTQRIGESGGQGSVYRVKHRLWGQTLAVKVFHNNAEGDAWRRELNSLTFLTHVNIVRMMYIVYETLEDRIQCRAPVGYAMELMAHSAQSAMESMAQSAADQHEYTLEKLLKVFEQIASALAFSHEQGVVHLDVKPENILLNESWSVAKLCDFGCAQMLHATVTASTIQRNFRGTLLYMAPEALHRKTFLKDSPLDKLCDIYSFGRTMWKLLHPSRDLEINLAFPVDREDVPLALKELVEQCTKHDPTERPENMSDVLKRLELVSQEYERSMYSTSATLASFQVKRSSLRRIKSFSNMLLKSL